jgi:predicted kinase
MQAIVFSGIQGSGKTTFFRERFATTHVLLSLDLLRTRNREDILLHACLAAQQPFVIDNTNPTAKARSRYARLAKAAGFEAVLYFFECAIDDAIARNAGRPETQRVPDLAVRGTAAKLEPASAAEGFDAMFRVRSVPGGDRFDVQAIQSDSASSARGPVAE